MARQPAHIPDFIYKSGDGWFLAKVISPVADKAAKVIEQTIFIDRA